MRSKLYYESHVTIAPVFDEKLVEMKAICVKYKFRVADLILKHKKADAAKPYEGDSFCTSRGVEFEDIRDRTVGLMVELREKGFEIWRYKIEDTLLDSKSGDDLFPLRTQGE